MMHARLVGVLTSILKDTRISEMAVVTKARGLRDSYATRPGDVVVLNFFAEGRHLVVDA
jgi:hypothetical protein